MMAMPTETEYDQDRTNYDFLKLEWVLKAVPCIGKNGLGYSGELIGRLLGMPWSSRGSY